MNWNERYEERHTPWDRGGPSPALFNWLESGVSPSRVVVPGCGRGHEVVELARRGFEVVAVDVAPRALRELEETLTRLDLQAELVCADVLTWEPERAAEAVYEQTCFCALDPAHWVDYARQLSRWTASGGELVASFMQTGAEGGPPFHCDLAVMRELFPEREWVWPEGEAERIEHPRGDIFELQVVLRKKTSL